MTTRAATLAEVITRALDARCADLRVSLPAEIVKYDPATQLASVKPLLRESFEQEDGTEGTEGLPVIPDVPVQFPGAGGFSLVFPVQPGDPCLLVFADRALDKWIDSGREVDPVDLRRHALTDAVALLGVRPQPKRLQAPDTDAASLGRDGGPRVFFKPSEIALGAKDAGFSVALAERVLAELNKIRTAFNTHTHAVATTGSASAQTGTAAAPVTQITAPGDVASSVVKVVD